MNTSGYLTPAYQGAWGAFLDYPSGIVVVSDMQSGLFVLNVDSLTLGINGIKNNEGGVLVFPNPADDKFRLEISTSLIQKISRIELFDVRGRLLSAKDISQQPADKSVTITATDLSSGIYLLKVFFGQDLPAQTNKIIINHAK
jgi:hypothetical protein